MLAGGILVGRLPVKKKKDEEEEEEGEGCFLLVVVGKRARSQYWGLWTKYMHSHSGSPFRQRV